MDRNYVLDDKYVKVLVNGKPSWAYLDTYVNRDGDRCLCGLQVPIFEKSVIEVFVYGQKYMQAFTPDHDAAYFDFRLDIPVELPNEAKMEQMFEL